MDWRDSYRTRSLAFSFALVFYVPYGLHLLRTRVPGTVPVLYSILISFNFYLIILDPGAPDLREFSVLLVPRENSSPCLAPRVLFEYEYRSATVARSRVSLTKPVWVSTHTQVWALSGQSSLPLT